MKRTTVFLPEALERDLSVYAKRSGKPAASIVREAIAAYIGDDGNRHALPSFAAAFDSGHTDTAERADELLFRGVAPHKTGVSADGRPAPIRSAKPRIAGRRPAGRARRRR